MKLFKQILIEKNEAEEVSKLKLGIEELKKTQSAIDQMPDNKIKIDLQKKLNSAMRQLSDKEKKISSKSSPKPSADVTPPPQQTQQAAKTATPQQTQQSNSNTTSAVATPPPQQPAQAQQAKQGVPPPAEEAPKPSAIATPPQQQAAAQPAQKAEAPTDEEKTMLQKLHKSSYDPNSSTDKRNLEILRQARQEVGKDANLKTLANAVYAKQYAKGDAQKKGTVNVQPTAQQPAAAPATPQLNVPEIKNQSVQAVQQMKAPQEPFKMQAPQQTGTLAQGPTKAAAAAQQAQKQQTAQQPAVAPQPQSPAAAPSESTPFMKDLAKVGSALSKSVQNMYGGANKSQQQVASAKQPAKPESAEDESNEENCEDCENNCEKCKKNKSKSLNKITVQEKVNISKFLKHLSEKNYSSAHKYLKAIVDDKVNAKIAQRIAKI